MGKRAFFEYGRWAADEFTVYKKGGRSGHTLISDRKRYLLQLLTDPYRVAQFTVMRRSLSTAIDRGALSLSKWAEFPTAVSTAVYRGIPFADIPVQRGGAGPSAATDSTVASSSLRAEASPSSRSSECSTRPIARWARWLSSVRARRNGSRDWRMTAIGVLKAWALSSAVRRSAGNCSANRLDRRGITGGPADHRTGG